MKTIQNNEYSTDSKTIAGFIPTEESAQLYLISAKVLIFNDELMFLSSAQQSVKLTPRLMFLLTKDGLQGSSYFDEPLDTENEDDRGCTDLLDSLGYGDSVARKIKKNEEEKHIIYALSKLGSGTSSQHVSFLPNDPSQLVKRLLLLLGSKKAGNNNCFHEASTIIDQLIKMKIINMCQCKDILTHIK